METGKDKNKYTKLSKIAAEVMERIETETGGDSNDMVAVVASLVKLLCPNATICFR